MKRLAVSVVALGALTSVAWAEPIQLSENDLDQVTAGGPLTDLFGPIISGALSALATGDQTAFQNAFIAAGVSLYEFLNSFAPAQPTTASVAAVRTVAVTLPDGVKLTVGSATYP